MAHLELHGSGTKVQSVDLPKAGNLLIGSDAVCDIQILDTEVQPIHARLRIQQGQMQVEATPEGKSFRHNGRRVAQCMVAAGDELGFGGYRAIYFAGEPDSKPAQKPVEKPVQKPAPAPAPTPQKSAAARPEPVKAKPAAPVELSWEDFSEPVPVSPKTVKTSAKPEKISDSSASSAPLSAQTGQRSWLDRLLGKASVKPLNQGEPIVAVAGGRGLTTFADEEATGRKLATAPLIVLLVMTLTGLSATAFGLWWVIDRTRANRAFDSGIAAYENGDFRSASERLTGFLRMRPEEKRSSKAHVLETLSRVRELTSGASPQLAGGLTIALKELPPLVDEPAWKDLQMDTSEAVATLTRDLAAKAKQNGSVETVDQARSAYRLHTELAGDAAAQQRTRLKVDQFMAEAEAAVAKGEARTQALAAMDDALKARDSQSVFQTRDGLLAKYPELLTDSVISKKLETANQQVQENVKLLKISREASREEFPKTLGLPQTLFTRGAFTDSETVRLESPPAPNQIAVVSGGGLIVGLDQRSGSVLWQRPSGSQSGFEPLLIPEESPPSVLAYDDRDQSILRLALADGKLIWRQPLGDTPRTAPLVLGNRLILALPVKGQLVWVDLGTGRVNDGLDLKWPLTGSVIASANNQTLYVPADQSVLFMIQVEPKACLRSIYLGHRTTALRVPPIRSGRFLIFPENRDLNLGSLQTWLIDDRGTNMQRLQQEPLEGWSWFKVGQQGNLLWASHDRGGFSIFSIGDYTLAKPLSKVGHSAATKSPSHSTSTISVGQREALVLDRTIKHYRLDPQSGRLDVLRSWELPDGLPASSIKKFDDYVYLVFLSVNRDLGRTVMAIDLRQDQPLWTTSWGLPLELANPSVIDSKLSWLDPSGQMIDSGLKQSDESVAVEWKSRPLKPGPQSGEAGASEIEQRWVWHDDGTLRIGLSDSHPNQIQIQEPGQPQPHTLTLPIPTRLAPVKLDNLLFIAGEGGEVAIASAEDGSPKGQPFVPDYEKSALWSWSAIVVLEDRSVVLADTTGRLVRLVVEQDPPRLRQTARVQVEGKFAGTLVSTGRAVLALLADGSVFSLAGRDLSVQTKWTFPGAGTRLTRVSDNKSMIFHPTGIVRVIDASGQSEIESKTASVMPLGKPLLKSNQLVWLTQANQTELVVWLLSEPNPVKYPLKTWVLGPLIPDQDGWIVVERPGVLRRIPKSVLQGQNPAATAAVSLKVEGKP